MRRGVETEKGRDGNLSRDGDWEEKGESLSAVNPAQSRSRVYFGPGPTPALHAPTVLYRSPGSWAPFINWINRDKKRGVWLCGVISQSSIFLVKNPQNDDTQLPSHIFSQERQRRSIENLHLFSELESLTHSLTERHYSFSYYLIFIVLCFQKLR